MRRMYKDIVNFHQRFNISGYGKGITYLTEEERLFRIRAMQEELNEFVEAHTLNDEIDALVDLVVFAIGTAERMGFEWDPHWDEVMRANNEKEPCETAARSKRGFKLDLCKPEGWTPPNHETIINNTKVRYGTD